MKNYFLIGAVAVFILMASLSAFAQTNATGGGITYTKSTIDTSATDTSAGFSLPIAGYEPYSSNGVGLEANTVLGSSMLKFIGDFSYNPRAFRLSIGETTFPFAKASLTNSNFEGQANGRFYIPVALPPGVRVFGEAGINVLRVNQHLHGEDSTPSSVDYSVADTAVRGVFGGGVAVNQRFFASYGFLTPARQNMNAITDPNGPISANPLDKAGYRWASHGFNTNYDFVNSTKVVPYVAGSFRHWIADTSGVPGFNTSQNVLKLSVGLKIKH